LVAQTNGAPKRAINLSFYAIPFLPLSLRFISKMSHSTFIKSALVSVYYKDNLEPIIKKLHALGVKLYSTGGTLSFIEKLNIPVTAVDSVTTYPEIFGGRVKTLHPAIFGGILNRRDNASDQKEKAQHNIPYIDLKHRKLTPLKKLTSAEFPLYVQQQKISGM
jgi:phosphoribosylaminoimidazolecarboxamide formyltransferase / IMP cyclohydrolase